MEKKNQPLKSRQQKKSSQQDLTFRKNPVKKAIKPPVKKPLQQNPIEKPVKTTSNPVSLLAHLAKQTGTDKLEHGYISYYEAHFKDLKPDWLLEIGAWKGQSLDMWRQYFKGTTIATIENFKYDECVTKEELVKKAYYVYEGEQNDVKFLNAINEKFDIIIEDGSHIDRIRSVSFNHLFKFNLKEGGIYVIEDLHTSKDPQWQQGYTGPDTLLNALNKLINGLKQASVYFDLDMETYLKNHIEWAELYDEKILFVKKR